MILIRSFKYHTWGTFNVYCFKIVSMIQNLETIFDDIFVKTIFTSDISYHKI